MLDHVMIRVADLDRAKAFYVPALAPLGYAIFREHRLPSGGGAIGFVHGGKPDFWIGGNWPGHTDRVHVAFTANDRAMVQAFYDAALKAGASDNGAPGLRPLYHPNYYGAFVTDPDGHNVEAVCHRPVA